MTTPPLFEKHASLAGILFDPSCIIIADRLLPESILARLPDPILVEAGETLKTMRAVEKLAGAVIERRSSRPITLVAAGGGSVCDAVGFLASILWRGVDLWLLPTTLLAMVDSAHGGKTAVNLAHAKNQLGTFHPARRVLIVEEFLQTLSLARRREGMAELLKALLLGDAAATAVLRPAHIESCVFAEFDDSRSVLMPMLERAIACKLTVVEQDPRESKGIRIVLNLGHTIAHALELTAGVSHGEAVAWGLAAALDLSVDAGLEASAHTHIHSLLFNLLVPLRAIPPRWELVSTMEKDKKRADGRLRSVLLQAPGRPLVTDNISAAEWVDAFLKAHARFTSTPFTVSLPNPRRMEIAVEASKSELNRALVIAAQRTGKTTIIGRSMADDVVNLVSGLRALGVPVRDTPDGYEVDHRSRNLEREDPPPRIVHCGEGGSTFRFLLALAATHRRPTSLYASPALLDRPQDPLIRALRSGGATVERFEDTDGAGYRVTGWQDMPGTLSVDASQSSQFVSAIALLSAGADAPFNLRLMGEIASTPYFEMTLAMLEDVGVEILAGNDLYAFNPTSRLGDPFTMHIAPDASSEAVWRVAQFFEHPLEIPEHPGALQPDSGIEHYLDIIREGQHLDVILLDCLKVPDLVPVLAVAALRSMKPVRITGAGNLRHKESNRIEGLVASFNALGIRMQATADGVYIPGMASREGGPGLFDTLGDHRLVMAGFLLTLVYGKADINLPWSVTKSYPSFWDDARKAGFRIAMDTGETGRDG
jgi:3-dehydroquinate synthetase/5-enolpyruvylshikimate-3-phosphate synthase